MSFHTRRVKLAAGSLLCGGPKPLKSPRIAIAFAPALFERIAGEAGRRKIPFSAIVRERLIQAYRDSA